MVLDYELKREYQEFLQECNRDRPDSDGRPHRDDEEVAEWAREHDLPYFDDQVHFPDVRIEYDDRDGRSRVQDIEVVTPHYRGAHGASAARSGFTCYYLAGVRAQWRARRGGTPNSRRWEDVPMNLPQPPNRWDIEQIMTDRAQAIAACGFTERQARFLVTVMLHSGVFVERQDLRLRRHRPRPEDRRLPAQAGRREVRRRRSRPDRCIAVG